MEIEKSASIGATLMLARGSGLRRGSSKGGGNQGLACQRHGNWEQVEVLTFIQCKHVKHVAHKQFTNP